MSAHRDLREMVNALHELDIEVWMQVREWMVHRQKART